MIPWQHLTFIGDSILTMPAAAAIAVWLITAGAWRMALFWSLMFGGALALVLATKIAFIGWGIGLHGLDFTGISGHATRACAVLPVLAWLPLRQARHGVRTTFVIAACLLGLAIALSRLVLHYHSASEVITGIGLGTLVAVATIRRLQGHPGLQLQRWVVGLTMLALVPSTSAQPAPTSQWVTAVALYLSGNDRPYVRGHHGGLVRAPAPSREH